MWALIRGLIMSVKVHFAGSEVPSHSISLIYAKHSCVAARGIKSDCETKTIAKCGSINIDEIL